jgi:O-antigen ligase
MEKVEKASQLSIWLDRGTVVWLFVFAAFAPHSIAVTQAAWLLGGLFWVARFFLYPRSKTYRTPLDYSLLGFFILTGISAVLSYEPMTSIGKLRAASLFTIVYLFAENIPSRKILRALALTLIASCMVNVFYTAVTRAIGQGVKVLGVSAESPLSAATMTSQKKSQLPFAIVSGDTVLAVNGQAVRNADQIVALLSYSPDSVFAIVTIYRGDQFPPLRVPTGRLLKGATAAEQLGISGWIIGRDWRATGFFGHFTTYAEALQLIGSLALGLFICVPLKKSRDGILLLVALAGIIFALLLTVTRASWLAFLISGTLMLLLGTSRRIILIAFACAIPLVLAGALLLQQKRHVGLIDQMDASTTWRETVWREGFHLLISKPRHLIVGVGMDSLKKHWRQWGLFDEGRIPIGHMHSNPLELALERGVPTLFVWLLLLGTYAHTLARTFRKLQKENLSSESKSQAPHEGLAHGEADILGAWVDRGIVLGALGGLVGFFVSGLVHYNWGDSEVIMIFYFIMGLSLVVERLSNRESRG